MTFSRGIFCERGTTDCLIVREYFCWIAVPVGIDSKKGSSFYFVRLHGISFGKPRRRMSSCLSLPPIVPPLDTCKSVLAGIRSRLLRRKCRKMSFLPSIAPTCTRFFSVTHAMRSPRTLRRVRTSRLSAPTLGGKRATIHLTTCANDGTIRCRVFRHNARRIATADSTSGQSHAQFRSETIDSSYVRYTRTVLEQLKDRKEQTVRTVGWLERERACWLLACTRTIYMD